MISARKARRDSYAAANPLSLGRSTAGTSQRGSNSVSTPLGWLAGKMTGLGYVGTSISAARFYSSNDTFVDQSTVMRPSLFSTIRCHIYVV